MTNQPNPDPTPEQIAERAAEIRRGWSADEERRRYRHDERYSIQDVVSTEADSIKSVSSDC
jgi:hypothetical protein